MTDEKRCVLFLFRFDHSYSPAQVAIIARAFTVSELLDKPRGHGHGHKVMATRSWSWSQEVPSPAPPGRCLLSFFQVSTVQHSHFSDFYARRFASNFTNSRCRAFRLSISKKASLVKIRTSTSIITRLTIGTTGDAGYNANFNIKPLSNFLFFCKSCSACVSYRHVSYHQ